MNTTKSDHNGRSNSPSCRMFALAALLTAAIGWQTVSDPKPTAANSVRDVKRELIAPKPEYNRDIRPIFAENCFACHGPDSAARKAELRLDVRESAIIAKAIVPGKPGESKLVSRIYDEDVDKRMPPRKSHKLLTAAQKETLKQWIADGAEYQPHWAFITPKRPPPPIVKNKDWVRNPIDQFILAELEKRGLQPATEADRRTLARRVSLDLTGLPPKPEDLEEFVNDKAADAYERFVHQLMKSEHWGEHRGRYWLDAARYADTHGIHFDNYREIWTYREWVINAFNRNQRFDQFTLEQLAGDLLPNPSLEQRVATGFNRCNITTNEGGAINEEYIVLYTRDRTETASQVWMGLTAGCAVCHDHKFDPLSQRGFYRLSAYFNNTTQGAMDGNVKDTAPVITVPKLEDRKRWEALSKEITEVRGQIEARKQSARAEFDKWLGGLKPIQVRDSIPPEGLKVHALLSEGAGQTISIAVDGQQQQVTFEKAPAWSPGHVAAQAFKTKADTVIEAENVGDFEKDKPFSFGAWVRLPRGNTTGAVFARMEDAPSHRGWDLWVENNRFGAHIISNWPDDAVKVVSPTPVKANEWNHVFITYDGSAKAAGVKIYVNGVAHEGGQVTADGLKNTIRTQVPFKIGQRHSHGQINDLLIQDLRLYKCELPPLDVFRLAKGTRAAWLASKPADKRPDPEKNELFDWWLPTQDKTYQDVVTKVNALQAEEAAIRGRGQIAHVTQEKPGDPIAHVLFRGDYDKRREQVESGTPAFLPPMPADFPRNRLGFAQWLLMPEHPLTARVTVNRFWQEVFGTGIVRSSGDFGVTGELPSHPELLDWLAVEFRESGWDVKQFFKLIVTSAAYRQSAVVTKEKLEKDVQNRLLSRGPRFRMDAEMVRDYALSTSGLLVPKLGGPSVRPYQPLGVWEAVAMIGSDTRDYRRDSGEHLYRRSMYTFWKRAAPPASLDILNAPNRETCTVRRERTNTPLQALVTLNDTQFVEAARNLAQLTLKDGGDSDETRLDFMARRLLCRSFKPEEAKVVQAVFKDLLTHYQAKPEEAKKLIAVGESKADPKLDAAALAAWTMVANQLMNLDEVLNK